MKRVRLFLGVASCSLVLIAGCGGGEGLEGAVSAGGIVTLDGNAVDGATVSFVPDGEGRSASALTSADGKYRLTTIRPGDGAMPGKYKISVSKISHSANTAKPASQEEGMKQVKEMLDKYGKEGMSKASSEKPKDLLPAKYKDAATSGLFGEVQATGDNTFKLELTSK